MENDAVAALNAIRDECLDHLPKNWKTTTLTEPHLFYARMSSLMSDAILSLRGSPDSAEGEPK